MTFAQYVDKAEERSGRWQAKACPTIAGTRPAGVGHALACLAHLLLLALGSAAMLYAQTANTCACGANPPGPPPNREQHPYANAPEDMRPFSKFTVPYYENYGSLVQYNGAARDVPTVKPEEVDDVRIGFLGPVENHPDQRLGQAMLHGEQLAIEEANGRGAYGGKPFKLMVHNDQAIWGASSNEMVKMAYDEKVWAMLGSIGADSTHIALRVSLKAEVQRGFHTHRAARVAESRSAHRQQRVHRPHDSGNHHSLVSHHHPGRSRAGLHAGAPHLQRCGPEEDRLAAHQRPLRPLWRAQVQRRLAQAGAPGDDRAEIHARRYGFPPRPAHHQRVRRGRNRDLGRRGARREHPQADARNGHEAARLRQLPGAG